MNNAQFAERFFKTPAADLTVTDAREELTQIISRLGAGYGYADETIIPGSDTHARWDLRRRALRRRLGALSWQRTQTSWCHSYGAPRVAHKRQVVRAMGEGEMIPDEVLADYPDLAAQQAELVQLFTRKTELALVDKPNALELSELGLINARIRAKGWM